MSLVRWLPKFPSRRMCSMRRCFHAQTTPLSLLIKALKREVARWYIRTSVTLFVLSSFCTDSALPDPPLVYLNLGRPVFCMPLLRGLFFFFFPIMLYGSWRRLIPRSATRSCPPPPQNFFGFHLECCRCRVFQIISLCFVDASLRELPK